MKTTLTRYLALAGTLSFLLSASSMQAQIVIPTTGYISTIAGDGTSGSTGNGGLATSAELSNNPTAVAVDQTTGDVYIADASNNVIRKVTASTGDISIFAGTGTYGYSGDSGAATSAKLANPHGVAVDTNGNVYIADSSNNRVRMVYKSGLSGLGFTAGDIYLRLETFIRSQAMDQPDIQETEAMQVTQSSGTQ